MGVYHGILMGLENLLNKTTVNKRKVSKKYFYTRCAITQLFVTAAVIVYSGAPIQCFIFTGDYSIFPSE
ncbi:hypothetical protein LJK87_36550 [Paenibacillus sp. P25]|nr:hypothetical protein LJK87_36550 [Paenibacillus sp. P25]